MRKLRVLCDACGEVTLPAHEIMVSGAEHPGQVNCTFRCPECETGVEKSCDVATGRLLLLSGATTKPATARVASPLGLADLVLLRDLMDRPDFATLMGKP